MTSLADNGIPIIVGVTGHRDLRAGDGERLFALVCAELEKLKASCPHSQIALLCSFAAGADQLCARVALALSIPVIAALPMAQEAYEADFSETELPVFRALLSQAADVFAVPDTEQLQGGTRDYAYRQAGIYVARHCHVLLALWDGIPGKPDGCGTAEAVGFALHDTYKTPAARLRTPEDGVVLHIVTPRRKNAEPPADAFAVRWLGKAPSALQNTLRLTDAYNADAVSAHRRAPYALFDDAALESLGAGASRRHSEYCKADSLAVLYRDKYLRALKLLSATGVALMLAFLLYDEAESNLFLPLYGLAALIALFVYMHARRGEYHRKYLEYRFFAEMLRVQLCLNAGGVRCEAGTLLTRAQTTMIPWAYGALQALCIGAYPTAGETIDIERVWIDDQLQYHTATCGKVERAITAQRRISGCMLWVSVLFFLAVCVLEFGVPDVLQTAHYPPDWLARVLMMREGAALDGHSAIYILLGVVPMVTLFVSSYYGKLSLPRKLDDRRRMAGLFAEAKLEYTTHPEAREAILVALAREELIEAGAWLTYCSDNQLDILL